MTRPVPVEVTDSGSGLPAWIEPQLATLTKDRFSDPAWIFERKLDGERCIAFADPAKVRLMSRNQRDISRTFPEVGNALEAQLMPPGYVLDGEIVAFDSHQTSFARLQRRLGVENPGQSLIDAVPVFYYLFDVMHAEGRDTRALPQLERKDLLRQLLSFRDPLRYTDHRERDGQEYFRQACRDGWEGLIAKRADAPYRSGRGRYWLKFKCENAQEFVIGGYTDPKGTRPGFGALLIGYYDTHGRLTYAGKVGTGFSDATLRSLRKAMSRLSRGQSPFERGNLPRTTVHWVEPQLVGQIAFTEWTRDGQLRHPRFQGLRPDKDPAEVRRETV